MIPPTVTLFSGGFDLDLVAIKTERLNSAVEAASRCQAIGATLCSNETLTAAHAAKAAGVDASNFTVAREACSISVTAAYQYKPMLLPAVPSGVA